MCVCPCRRLGDVPRAPSIASAMASTVTVLLRPHASKSKLAGGKAGVDVWRERRWRKGRPQQPQNQQNPQQEDEAPKDASDRSLLKCLALQALELSAPASDVLLKSGSASPWFQLAGHPDCFAPAGPGRIWKKVGDETERLAYESLAADPLLRGLVPRYYGSVTYKDHTFIELQDLLHGFHDPHVIDVKMGTRTFLESEVDNPTARADLYQKMVAQDPRAPTSEEHEAQAVTKVRYMQFREQQSSTHFLGFRVDAMKERGLPPRADRDIKKVGSREEVVDRMSAFLGFPGQEDVKRRLVDRLEDMRSRIEQSHFFHTHEVIGCSIFMLYDDRQVGAWLIDFAKTVPVPEGRILDHRTPWTPGNNEEGFLLGLDNLIDVMNDV